MISEDAEELVVFKPKWWSVYLSIIIAIIIYGFVISGGDKNLIFNLTVGWIAYFFMVIKKYRQFRITLSRNSITKNNSRKEKILHFDNIAKIEYKLFPRLLCLYESGQSKYSMAVSPGIYGRNDIKYIINAVLSKKPDVRLNKRAKIFLAK